jgi:N-methylhydantoinase A
MTTEDAVRSGGTKRGFRIAVDVGGTFTDLVLAGPGLGERAYKTSSTPKDPSDGFFTGLGLIARDLALSVTDLLADTSAIVHGTTITTNALLTSAGAVTGLVTTQGFRDVLLMRQGHRERQFDSKRSPRPPLVPRYRTLTVPERIDRTGSVTLRLDEVALRSVAGRLRDEGVEAIAITFLFSFFNSDHERRAAEILAEELPGVFITQSAEIAPEVRLYERTSTTVLNAYVGPVLSSYLARLEERLAQHHYDGPVLIMQSNGGVIALHAASEFAVNTLLSGPAGGPVASASIVEPIGIPKTMTIDMGGTSFEVSLAHNGRTETRSNGELAGQPIATPMLDISTIGAGGGSIAWITQGGMLRVGPQSAGALPGPASYLRGGTEPTVTDANLLLGYLKPVNFGGGELVLDRAAAEAAVAPIADALGIGQLEAAAGIYRAVNASMTDSIRLATVRKGHDPREFALIAAGGAGPAHAVELARDLDIPLVVVPRDASVLCAAGMLLTDYAHHYVRTLFGRPGSTTPHALITVFSELETQARDQFTAEWVPEEAVSFERSADVRYVGQVHEIEVPIYEQGQIDQATLERLAVDFEVLHNERFGHSLVDTPTEIVNVRLHGVGRTPKLPKLEEGVPGVVISGQDSKVATRLAWFEGSLQEVAVFDATRIGRDALIDGPALIELPTSTIVLPPAYVLEVGPLNSLLIHRADQTLAEVIEVLRRGADRE